MQQDLCALLVAAPAARLQLEAAPAAHLQLVAAPARLQLVAAPSRLQLVAAPAAPARLAMLEDWLHLIRPYEAL